MPLPPLVLDNPVLDYAWGSRTAIGDFLGRPSPGGGPEAELWIGAHPRAPSRVVDPPGLGTLEEVIERDPVGLLGAEVCDRFGNQLPFLLKVLAAAEPLSIQAHPDRGQARRGWARENEEGIPLDAPRRNYRDLNHKPELVCALTPFVALKGFRPGDELCALLEPIAGAELRQEVRRLHREPGTRALRALFTRLMTLEDDEKAPLLARAAAHARRRGDKDAAWSWVERLLERYPGDVGTLSPVYLNLVTLAPEEALFLPAGELHAYLEGTALEIMANSDNVLRGGLTPKHVDVPELLATLSFESHATEVLRPQPASGRERVYPSPAREFRLELLDVPHGEVLGLAGGEPTILLGLEGQASLGAGGRRLPLGRGQSVFVPAGNEAALIEGPGQLVRARVPA
jgi:mannose-6-phosphate isomerase